MAELYSGWSALPVYGMTQQPEAGNLTPRVSDSLGAATSMEFRHL